MKFIYLSFCLLISNLSFSQTETISITVQPHKNLQNYEHFKRLVFNASDPQVEYIKDFDYEWGYTYELQVKKHKFEQEWSDGTQYEFTLDKVISKTPVDESYEFQMTIDPLVWYYIDETEGENNYSLKAINDTTYLFLDEIEIEIPEDQKELFAQFSRGKVSKRGAFVFTGKNKIRWKQWKW